MDSEIIKCSTCGSPVPLRGAGDSCPRCLLRICITDEEGGGCVEVSRELPGTVIGRYTLIDEIGEGGFGIVYLAEQAAPVRRKVALKVLKPGMDTREVVSRFKAERQALALMDHPNIAQVYDGGATDSGRPYFVMELVDGTPITKYCDRNNLSMRQRIGLFLDVTSAVNHAHQKGIIHRDLKPSNILVSNHEGRPVVKVIDFGVAKAVGMNLAETAVLTGLGRMIGTPEYMSPEQADLNVVNVDTRSDIYSLGAVLYELITGTTPIDPALLRKVGLTEMLRIIREDKPLNPSLRVDSLRRRGAREIDWVVMQALEKDPARRYQTAMGFGMDIKRFLDDEPVSASPPSASYRCKKFAKRHRLAVAWSGVFTLVVIAAAIGMTILYLDRGREARVAREQRAAAVDAEDVALRQTWEARVSEAAALRWSGKPERRFHAFEALREATAITNGHDDPANMKRLRDSAIACLAIVDMRPIDSWKGNPGYGEMVSVDAVLARYATTFPDGRVVIRSYPDHKLLLELPGAGDPVGRVLRFSPGGDHLAVVYGTDMEVRLKLWDSRNPAPAVDAGECVNQAFACFPDSKRAVVGRPDGRVEVIDLASGRVLRSFGFPGRAYALGVSREGRWLAVAMAGRVEVLDVAAGTSVAVLECPARAVAWSPVDDALAVGCADGVLRLWRDEDWSSAAFGMVGHTRGLDAVAWSPDGRLLVSQGMDATIRLWDPFQGSALSWHPGRASDLGFSADGRRLGMLCDGETLTVMEVEPGDVCMRGRNHAGFVGVADGAWNPEGTLLATSGDDGVRIWNRNGRHLGFIKVARARGIAFSKDSLFVASSGGLQRWGVQGREEDGGLVMTFEPPEAIDSFVECEQISLSKDSSMMALAGRRSGDGEAAMWLLDLRNRAVPKRLESPLGVASCALSPDGRWLAAGTHKGDGVRIWELGAEAKPVDLPVRGSAKVVFSPDGKWLVTGDTEAYRFWVPGSWNLARSIPSQMSNSSGLMAYSPRMTAFTIACRGAELKVLNPFTLEEISAPDFDRESPLCFDPYGRVMMTTGQSGGLFFWKLDEVRARLVKIGLDWEHMPPFPALELPEVKRVDFRQ